MIIVVYSSILLEIEYWRVPHGVMVNVLDYNIIVSKFEFQSGYYIHFQPNILGKDMNPLSFQLWVK